MQYAPKSLISQHTGGLSFAQTLGWLAAIMVFWTMLHLTCHLQMITAYQRMHMLFFTGHAFVDVISVLHSTQAVPCTQHGRTCLWVWSLQALHREC